MVWYFINILGEFESIFPAAQFCGPSFFAISVVRILRYVSGAVQDRTDNPDGLTCPHCFCLAGQLEMPHRVTEGVAAPFAARQWGQLLYELNIAALLSLDKALMRTSCLTFIFRVILERQCRYYALSAGNCMKKIDRSTREPTVWIHQSASIQLGSSLTINPRSGSRPALSSSIQMNQLQHHLLHLFLKQIKRLCCW